MPDARTAPEAPRDALDRARGKAYRRLLPILFACYVVAYIDRNNLSIAIETMKKDLPAFDNDVLGTGAGVFFLGYFLLEIPGTLLVEKWSARKWISRIMISWGIVAACTAAVRTPWQFYGVRFVLGLAEAGFFPGVIVYLTHWFPSKDRARALSWFLIATPIAQFISPMVCYPLLRIGTEESVEGWAGVHRYDLRLMSSLKGKSDIPAEGKDLIVVADVQKVLHFRIFDAVGKDVVDTDENKLSVKATQMAGLKSLLGGLRKAPPLSPSDKSRVIAAITSIVAPPRGRMVHYPEVLGLEGWQWVYIGWGIPAVVLGLVVLAFLTDRPGQARWLAPDEREALERELAREKAARKGGLHMTLGEALSNPKVLLLAAAYFFIVTGNYGVEFFLPTILKKWYKLTSGDMMWLLAFPALGSLLGQLFVGWNSDRTKERRMHTAVPIYIGAAALACTLLHQYPLWLMMVLFTLAATGLKAYLPAFWSLPSLFLTEAAAAGSIGLINSVGNLGGFVGPKAMGWLRERTGTFSPGILFLCISITVAATIIMSLSLGRRAGKPEVAPDPLAEALAEPA